RISGRSVAHRVDEFPEITASGIMEALQHGCDRFPAGMSPEEAVLIGSVFGEHLCEPWAVIFHDGGGEGIEQAVECDHLSYETSRRSRSWRRQPGNPVSRQTPTTRFCSNPRRDACASNSMARSSPTAPTPTSSSRRGICQSTTSRGPMSGWTG